MLNWLFRLIEKLSSEWNIVILIIFLIVGFILLVKGANLFVDSSSSLAHKLGISSLIIGLTIVSFGTSAPEASVSITSAVNNASDLSISNVVGSNIFNLMVVLGASLLFGKIIVGEKIVKRDLPVAIISTILLLLFVISYGTGNYLLSRIDGIILLAVLVVYLVVLIKTSKPDEEVIDKKIIKMPICILMLIFGLLFIIMGGELVTYSAKTFALKIGVSELVVGLTIVAIGTSLPELTTSIIAAKKGENEIAIGNVIGSNIFNILFILGISSLINPLTIATNVIIDIIILLVLTTIFFLVCIKKREYKRKDGIIFIIIYAAYLTYIILREFI